MKCSVFVISIPRSNLFLMVLIIVSQTVLEAI